ncbi:hypothetical protein AB0I28_06845 [Phytomonospora sp. NPDC050363]|uniref:hypothetical protein n=1 Tax=Phytomonospora sp. NPDC050363 TaxID=3155642 RepID=UPI0033F68ECD
MTESEDDLVPMSTEPEDASSPMESLRKGGPKAFLALTCGFLLLLCCMGGCVTGGVLGFARTGALNETREGLGAPVGWSSSEASTWPWAAYMTLTGPADPLAFESWLDGHGAEYDSAAVTSCLAAADPCELDFTVGQRTVRVAYHGGDEGKAEVTVT